MPPDALDELLSSLPSAPRGTINRTSHLNELIGFAKENNLTVGSTTGGHHNRGSKHYTGNAIDIKGSGAFDDNTVNTLKQQAAQRGFLLRDERRKPPGQKVWGGPHVHIEVADTPQITRAPQNDPLDDLLADLPDASQSHPIVSSRFGTNAPVQRGLVRGSRKPIDPFTGVTGSAGILTRPQTSRADLEKPVYEAQGGEQSINVNNIDPRILKGEQPADRLAYMREGDIQSRMPEESYRDRVAREKVETDWRAKNQPAIERQVQLYKRDIQKAKKAGGDANQWIAEFGNKAASGLSEFAAGVTGADTLRIKAEAAHRAAQEEGANRGAVSKFVQDVGAGFIGSAPELAAMALGAPPVATFAAGSGIRARGSGQDVPTAVAHGAATGAAFELPTVGEGVTKILSRAGGVGAGSTAVELAAGRPLSEAIKTGATNALVATAPEFIHLQFGKVKAAENQTGVGRGRVRVVDESGAEHVIQKPSAGGRGNERAIPVKVPTAEAVPAEQAAIQPPVEAARVASLPPRDAIDELLDTIPARTERGQENVDPVQQTTSASPTDTSVRGSGDVAAPIKPRVRVLEGGPRPKVRLLNEPAPTEAPPIIQRDTFSSIKPEPSITSARKEMFKADRAELDLPELPPAERRGWQETLDKAKAKGTQNAGVLADEVLAKPRALSDVETGQLVLRAQEIKDQHSEVMKEIGAASDPEVISAKRDQADALQREFDKITEATKKSGTEKGRALASQKLTINQDFDLVSVLQRAKAAKGRELNPDERVKFEGLTKQIEELQTKLIDAEAKVKATQIQKEISKIARQRKRSETKEVLDDEFAALKAQFAKARMEIPHVQAAGLASLDPEGVLTRLIAQMARNRVKAGTVRAEALVDEIYTAVKEHVGEITKRDIRDAISGYGLESKRTRSELQKELDRLKSEMYRVSSQEDIEAGKRAARREGPSKREQYGVKEGPRRGDINRVPLEGPRKTDAYRLPMEGPRKSDIQRVPVPGPKLSEASRSGIPLQGPRLSDAQRLKAAGPRIEEAPFIGPRRSDVNKVRAEGPRITDAPKLGPKNTAPAMRRQLQGQINELERRIREKDYSEPPKRGPIVYDRETSNLKARVEQLKRKIDADIRGTDSKLETILAMRKAGMLTGIRTHIRNVGGTGAFQAFEEVSRVPGAIADLLVSTVTHRRALGAPNPIDVAKSSYTAATKGVREAMQIVKYGATAEDLAKLERPREMNSGSKIIDAYVNTVFRTLGAEDKVFRTYAFKRSIEDQARLRAKEFKKTAKELSENPPAEMVAQAALDAEVATFNNPNKAAKGVEWLRRQSGPVGSTAIDLVLPFKQTPANIASRLMESTPLGLGRGGLQLLKAAINKKMSFKDQRKFSQTIGRSVTGSGLIALGYWMAQNGLATGLSEDNAGDREVQKASGRSPLSVKVGNTWHQIGAFSPIGNVIAIGAALHRENTRPLKEGEERGSLASAAVPVGSKVLMDQPFLRGASGVVDALENPGRAGEAFIAQTAGSAIPTLVTDAGAVIDNKRREGRGIIGRIQARVPIARSRLPEQVDVFARPLESRRTGFADPTISTSEKSDPFIKELIRLDVGVPKANKQPGENDAQLRERQIRQGKAMADELSKVVETRSYQSMSDEDKAKALKDAVEKVRKAVNEWIKTGGKRQPRIARQPRTAAYRYTP